MKKCTLYWHRESDGMMDGGEQNTEDVIGRYFHIICEGLYWWLSIRMYLQNSKKKKKKNHRYTVSGKFQILLA